MRSLDEIRTRLLVRMHINWPSWAAVACRAVTSRMLQVPKPIKRTGVTQGDVGADRLGLICRVSSSHTKPMTSPQFPSQKVFAPFFFREEYAHGGRWLDPFEDTESLHEERQRCEELVVGLDALH